MSADAIARLSEANAFLPTAKRTLLAIDHVPFEDLTGAPTESAIVRAADEEGCIAVLGETGAGKSSLIAHVSTLLNERGYVPLRIGVLAAEREAIRDSGRFAQHVIREVLHDQEGRLEEWQRADLAAKSADEVRETRVAAKGAAGLGVTPIPRVKVELAGELQTASREYLTQQNPTDAVAGLERIVGIINFRSVDGVKLQPLFVIEDTDAWLADTPDWELIDAFFNLDVRLLAREIHASTLIAVHPRYCQGEGYRSIRDPLVREVEIPHFLKPAEAIGRILQHRVDALGVCARVTDLFEPEALRRLGTLYDERGRNIRSTLSAAHYSLEDPPGKEVVRVEEVEYAINTKIPGPPRHLL